jgi:hypothetical protein
MSVIRTGGLIALRQSFTSIGAAREGDGPLVEAWLNERLIAFLSPYKAIRKLRLHPAAAGFGRRFQVVACFGRERGRVLWARNDRRFARSTGL